MVHIIIHKPIADNKNTLQALIAILRHSLGSRKDHRTEREMVWRVQEHTHTHRYDDYPVSHKKSSTSFSGKWL